MSLYEYRIQLVHDPDCYACNFQSGAYSASIQHCTTCHDMLSMSETHQVQSQDYCVYHADEKADSLAMVTAERRLIGEWETFNPLPRTTNND
jgi:hypothetical protein